jgi:hypothetical protein
MPGYPLGIRELSADFGGIKTGNLSLLKRPDALTFDYLTAFSLGPVALGDSSQGPIARPWYVRADNATKTVYTAKANDTNDGWEAEQVLFVWVGNDINEVDFAFEQAGRPVVTAERTIAGVSEIWLYWFKPFLGAFTFEKFDNGRTPRLVLDNPPDTANSDVEFFYLKTGVGLVVRTQREAYAVAHATPHVEETDWYLEDVFYTNSWRVALLLVKHNPGGQYVKKRMETALMPVFFTPVVDAMTVGGDLLSLEDRITLIKVTQDYDALTNGVGISSIDDHALFIFHTLYDTDGMTGSVGFQSIDDHTVLLFHTLYDKDGIQLPFAINSLDDRTVLFFHTLYDKDGIQLPISIQSIDDS